MDNRQLDNQESPDAAPSDPALQPNLITAEPHAKAGAPDIVLLIGEVHQAALETAESRLQDWISTQAVVLDEFLTRIESLAKILAEQASRSDSSTTLYAIALHADELSGWIKAQMDDELFVPQTMDAAWATRCAQLLKTVPAQVELHMGPEDWASGVSDRGPVKLWKSVYRQRAALRNFWWRLTGFTRRKTADSEDVDGQADLQASQGPPPFLRRFPLHDFLQYYALLPLAELHRRAWMRHMDLLRVQIHQMRKISSDLYTQILQGDLFKDAGSGVAMDLEATQTLLAESRDRVLELRAEQNESLKTLQARAEALNQDVGSAVIQAWKLAGTLLRRPSSFGKRALERKLNSWQRVSKRYRDEWLTHMRGETDDWRKHVLFSRLEFDSSAAFHSGAAKLEQQKNAAAVRVAFDSAVVMLKEAEESIDSLSTNASAQRFETNLQKLSDGILARCADHILPKLIEAVLSIKYDAVVGSMSTTFADLCNRLPTTQRFFLERDAEGNPPHSETGHIPLRTIVNDGFMRDLQKALRSVRDTIVTEREEIMRGISDIDDMIFYASAAAIKMLQEPEDQQKTLRNHTEETEGSPESPNEKARRIVAEGIQRAQSSIDSLSARMDALEEQVNSGIRETANSFVTELRTLHNTEKLTDLKLQATRTKMRAGVQDVRYRLQVYRRYLRPRMVGSLRRTREFLSSQYDRLRTRIGLARPMEQQHQNLQRMVLDAEKRVNGLPYVYQRLFALEPLSDDRFLIGRTTELEKLSAAYQSWRAGQYQAAAVIGESGSGKSSVLNFAEKRCFQNTEIFRVSSDVFSASGPSLANKLGHVIGNSMIDDLPALREHIIGIDKPVVFIVEDFQRMYLRTMDGFQVMEDFLLFMAETYRDCFWVVSCKQYAWQFLDLAIGVSRNFPLVLFLSAISRKDSEQVIMQRHRFSGYQVEFNLSPRQETSRKYRKLTDEKEKIEYRRTAYFDALHETADGNIAVMIKIWLQSIAEHDGQKLRIIPVEDREIALIDLLREEDYFVLAAILQHGSTDVPKLSKILKISQDKARLTLNFLANKGVLHREVGEFGVRLMLYRQIVRILQRRNIIQ